MKRPGGRGAGGKGFGGKGFAGKGRGKAGDLKSEAGGRGPRPARDRSASGARPPRPPRERERSAPGADRGESRADRANARASRFTERTPRDRSAPERQTERPARPPRGVRAPRPPGERDRVAREARRLGRDEEGGAAAPPFAKPRLSKPRFPERRGDRPQDRAKPDRAKSERARPERTRPHERAKPDQRGKPHERAFEPGRRSRREPREPEAPRAPEPVEVRAPAPELPPVATGVQTTVIGLDEDGMRLDRFFERRFPTLSFSHIQRIIRKGEVRLDGKRAEPKDRVVSGQTLRIPPLKIDAPKPRENASDDQKNRAFIKSITLYEDDDVMVLNKPMGLAVQGGSGTFKHVDGMLDAFRSRDGQRPRLVHRLDKDTSGCLLIAKSRFAAAALAKTFRSRGARKIYWALVPGVPKPKQGRISTFLAKEERDEDSYMRVAEHGEDGAAHAVTYYAVVETAAQKLSWLSLKPVTGRTHQLRAHTAHIGHPIVGDPKYFNIENWEFPGGLQNKLHLLARRLAIPHPRGGLIDVTAPLPPHMQQSWNLLGLDAARYDPIEDAPEE